MSKQSEAKERQGYIPKLIPNTCSRCAYFKMETSDHDNCGFKYIKETNLRCGLGGFKVNKTGTCNEWEVIL